MKIDVFELLDKSSKKEQRWKEWKEMFLVVSFTWILSMAFMVQFVVVQEIIVDIFSNTKRLNRTGI